MASTIPDLTFVQGSTYIPSLTTGVPETIAAIKTAIGASTYWEIKTDDSVPGPITYLLIGPKAGSAIPNCRILIGGNGTGPAFVLPPHTTTANVIYVGLAPDSGKNILTNPWNGALNPFDTDRFTKFIKCSQVIVSVACNYVWIVESEETLAIFFYNSAGDAIRGFHTGAIIVPPDDLDGEADGRIWGITTTGSNAMLDSFLTSVPSFLGSETSATGTYALFFHPQQLLGTPVSLVKTLVLNTPSSVMFQTRGGTAALFHISIRENISPYTYVGQYRQLAFFGNRGARYTMKNADTSIRGFTLSSKIINTAQNCCIFYNK